jgi:hypothetical protein
MRTPLRVTVTLAAVLIATVPVLTITNGSPDGTQHPYVAIAAQLTPDGGLTVCSGTALSAIKVLTAGHCFDPSQFVLVGYGPGPSFSFVPGIFIPDPAFCADCGPGVLGSVTHDVGLIFVLIPAYFGPFGALPQIGVVDTLPTQTPVDVVGYGVQGFIRGGGQPTDIFTAIRFFAPTLLVPSKNVSSAELITLTANAAQGKGGVCFGDSGSPALAGGTNVVLAVNTFVTNGNCAGVTYSTRVDVADIQGFINAF